MLRKPPMEDDKATKKDLINELELYIDGGARGNPGPAACAYLLLDQAGRLIKSEGIYLGESTNNIAEYNGLIRGLQAARELNAKELNIYSDSELLVKQIIGEYKVKNLKLQELMEKAQKLLLSFDRWQIKYIPREANKEADKLVNATLDEYEKGYNQLSKVKEKSKAILVEVIEEPDPDICAAGIKENTCFVIHDTVPSGLCIYALQAILPEIARLQTEHTQDNNINTNSSSGPNEAVVVKCSRSDCKARFRLKKI